MDKIQSLHIRILSSIRKTDNVNQSFQFNMIQCTNSGKYMGWEEEKNPCLKKKRLKWFIKLDPICNNFT